MAYSAGVGDRHDDMRYRSAQSPRDETFTVISPLRSIGSQMSSFNSSASDARGSLQRRFTTNTVPTLPTLSPLSPIGQQRRQAAEQPDYTTATFHKVQLLEKKKLEYEYLREQRRRFEAEMELLDRQARRDEDEMHRLASDLTRGNMPGRQSEPTTPPEYRDGGGFPNAFSKPNRYSSASITSLASPPGLSNRPSRSGSQITPSHNGHSQSISHIPSKSMPGSRRNSDEEEEDDYDDYEFTNANHRAAAALNRKSMPVTGYDLNSQRLHTELPDLASVLGHIDTTKFLFDDNEDKAVNHHTPVASPDRRSILHMNTTNDKDNFPILIRRDDNNTMQYSASSALELAAEQSPGPDSQVQSNGWSSFGSRHRQSQPSLPMNNLHQQLEDLNISSPVERPSDSRGMASHRRSTDLKFSPFGQNKRSSAHAHAQNGSFTMPKLQSSFSTNDIPTVKNPNGMNGGAGAITPTTANSHAEQHYHNHNASIGRIPAGAPGNRQSRDLSTAATQAEEQRPSTRMQSALHASAAPFNSGILTPSNAQAAGNVNANASMMGPYGAPAFFGGYGMNMMNQQMVPQQSQWAQNNMYQNPYQQYGPTYQAYAAGGRFNDSQPRVVQSRKATGQDQNRFQDFDLTTQRNEILSLCKDQYGCRFLQKKLEERNEEFTLAIFEETKDSVIELMTDPFGNYLCQKLLEYTSDDQRTVLIKNAAPSMVGIALNQHGTRALQKMIEYILNAEQISTIIEALQSNVVSLIQDLNGNHVIQKCLNHLKSQDAQFIFSAVGNNCVEVGTHRHGCCVLQRCIDHASGDQRNMLIHQITESSVKLVQDPFGNYVVQYILDLAEQKFTHPLCVKFMGRVVELSKQKFSSNVIEKCIRVAAHEVKRVMIDEILLPGELENVMRDPYANYVIQTALDYADNDTCLRLIESIRPIIPVIRQTPYGRRIQTKIQDREARLAQGSGPALIDPGSLATSPMTSPHNTQAVPYNPGMQSPPNTYANLSNGYQSSISPQRIGNQGGYQNTQHQPFGRAAPPPYGMNNNMGGANNNMGNMHYF